MAQTKIYELSASAALRIGRGGFMRQGRGRETGAVVFAFGEARKALIYKGVWRAEETPKAGVAGPIPAGVRIFVCKPVRESVVRSESAFEADRELSLGGLAYTQSAYCAQAGNRGFYTT